MPFSPLLTSVAPETVAGPTDRPWMASSRCSERHRTGATSGVVATTNPLTSLLCIALGDWLDQPPGGGQAFGTKPGALWSWFFVPRCLAPNSSANIGSRNSDVGWAFRTAATTALSYLPPPPHPRVVRVVSPNHELCQRGRARRSHETDERLTCFCWRGRWVDGKGKQAAGWVN